MDATALVVGETGVARYAAELLTALPGAGVQVDAVALGRGTQESVARARRLGVRHLPVPARAAQAVWSRVPAPRVEWLGRRGGRGPALVHTLDLPPGPTRLPVVLTVHDLDALLLPALHPALAAQLQQRQLEAARRAAAVCVPSGAVRDALVARGVEAGRIVVTPLGHTPLPAASEAVGVPGGLALAPGFVLAVGAVGLRKGHDVLLEAMLALPGVRLVVAGPDGHGAAEVRRQAAALGLVDRVSFLGRVSDGELAALYRDASALAFPSRAEGFGLPLVEAMAAELPVVASDLPVVREVVDGAALLVPVGDAAALAAGLAEVIAGVQAGGESVLACVVAGREAAARRTWAACAAATASAYQLALDS